MVITSENPPVITLTTDFGLQDEYVGILKGVILSISPKAQIIDITHAIPPQDKLSAARIVARSYTYFPRNSIHLVIVDPGVGSSRSIIALRAENHTFIAPDNGILSPLLEAEKFQKAHLIKNTQLFLPSPSNTFHGRDIMAPVAANLSLEMDISMVGPQVELESCMKFLLPQVEIKDNSIHGKIMNIDVFGNIQTSITADDLKRISNLASLTITICDHKIEGFHECYSDVEVGSLLSLLDSNNYLEIAINCGDAADFLQCKTGDTVILTLPNLLE